MAFGSPGRWAVRARRWRPGSGARRPAMTRAALRAPGAEDPCRPVARASRRPRDGGPERRTRRPMRAHLAAASGVAVELDLDRVPVPASPRRAARRLGVPPRAVRGRGWGGLRAAGGAARDVRRGRRAGVPERERSRRSRGWARCGAARACTRRSGAVRWRSRGSIISRAASLTLCTASARLRRVSPTTRRS